MRRELVKFPDERLNKAAKPVKAVDDEIRSILEDMAETMYAEVGVGLAAPQIGVNLRLAVIDVSGCEGDQGFGLVKMVNPEITSREGEIEFEEGCLSVPDFRQVMKRSAELTVRFLDENGEKRELAAKGLFAIAVQQEIDHLDGKLIIDSAGRLKRGLYIKKMKKMAHDS